MFALACVMLTRDLVRQGIFAWAAQVQRIVYMLLHDAG